MTDSNEAMRAAVIEECAKIAERAIIDAKKYYGVEAEVGAKIAAHRLRALAKQPTPSVDAMKSAVEMEISAAIGSITTQVIGRMIQKAIDASAPATIDACIHVVGQWVDSKRPLAEVVQEMVREMEKLK